MPAEDHLEDLARRLDVAAVAYYRSVDPDTALAFHAAKSALLAAVSREPGRRWWRGSTCYEATPAGLTVWSEPNAGPLPTRRAPARRGVRFHSGPGIVPRVGEPLHPWRSRADRRMPA